MTPEKMKKGFFLQEEMSRIKRVVLNLSVLKNPKRYYTRIIYQTHDTCIDIEVTPTEEYDKLSKEGQEAIRKLEKNFINDIKAVYEAELKITEKKFADL